VVQQSNSIKDSFALLQLAKIQKLLGPLMFVLLDADQTSSVKKKECEKKRV
jgi:hypothetical protein